MQTIYFNFIHLAIDCWGAYGISILFTWTVHTPGLIVLDKYVGGIEGEALKILLQTT